MTAKIILASVLALHLLMFPKTTSSLTSTAIHNCLYSVLPSLFAFTVISRIIAGLLSTRKNKAKKSRLFTKLFCLPSCLVPVCIMGLFFGAPSCSYALGDIKRSNLCTKDEAQRASVLCNNCSLAFILSFCQGFFEDRRIPLIIAASNILSTLTVYFLFFKTKESPSCNLPAKTNSKSLSEIVSNSISESAYSSVSMCGFIVFFYVVCGIVTKTLSVLLSFLNVSNAKTGFICAVSSLLFELTYGVYASSGVFGYGRILVVAMAVSFLGLSIIFQVKNALSSFDISSKAFIQSKILCLFVCPLYTLLFLLILPVDMPVVSQITKANSSVNFAVFASIFVSTVLIISKLVHTVNKKYKNKGVK